MMLQNIMSPIIPVKQTSDWTAQERPGEIKDYAGEVIAPENVPYCS